MPRPKKSGIGYYYAFAGIASIVFIGGFIGLEIYQDKEFTIVHLGIIIALIFLFMLSVRSDKFDNSFKTIVDKLPFTKYTKPD